MKLIGWLARRLGFEVALNICPENDVTIFSLLIRRERAMKKMRLGFWLWLYSHSPPAHGLLMRLVLALIGPYLTWWVWRDIRKSQRRVHIVRESQGERQK